MEHPQFAKNDFYITGESYAGHYIPAFAARVHHGNKAKQGAHINLKVRPRDNCYLWSYSIDIHSNLMLSFGDNFQGFAIGNGLTNPEIQYKAYSDYALDMSIIKKSDYERINKVLPVCETAIKLCGNLTLLTFSHLYPFHAHLPRIKNVIFLQAQMEQSLVWLLTMYAAPYSTP